MQCETIVLAFGSCKQLRGGMGRGGSSLRAGLAANSVQVVVNRAAKLLDRVGGVAAPPSDQGSDGFQRLSRPLCSQHLSQQQRLRSFDRLGKFSVGGRVMSQENAPSSGSNSI